MPFGRRFSAEDLAFLRDAMERETTRRAEEIFADPASGPRPSFKERDFGRWRSKIDPRVHARPWRESPLGAEQARRRERDDAADAFAYWAEGWPSPSRSKSTSHKDALKVRRLIFLGRGYLAVSEDPGVAVAAMGLRLAMHEERRAFWKIGADGMRVYQTEWFASGGPRRLELAEAKLRRRIKAALLADIDAAEEPALW